MPRLYVKILVIDRCGQPQTAPDSFIEIATSFRPKQVETSSR